MLDQNTTPELSQMVWPDCYYKETDPKARLQMLEQRLQTEDTEENRLRKLLWEKRYATEDGKIAGYDRYMKVLTQLEFLPATKKSLFGKKKYEKELQDIANVFQLKTLEEHKEYEKVWFDEYVNFTSFYITLCQGDVKFNSIMMSLGELSDSRLRTKIAGDLHHKTVELPKELGIEQDFALLAKAARAAFHYYYPETQD